MKVTGMDTGALDYHYKVVELRRENDKLVTAIKGALAALTQKKTYPADIEAAKIFLRNAIE